VSSEKTYCEFTAEENMTSNKHDKTINQSIFEKNKNYNSS